MYSSLAAGTYSGAIVTQLPTGVTGAISGFPSSIVGFDATLSIGNQFNGSSGVRALNLPNGNNGTTQRSGFELSWDNGLILTNEAGSDFVVYESGSNGTTPEAFMVQVHDRINNVWSIWIYNPASAFQVTSGAEGGFATSYDLSDFGIAANGEVDAIRVVNMTDEDRMVNASGVGEVIPEDNGATSTNLPDPGSLASFGNYGASTLDPDSIYVGILRPLTAGTPAFDANSALGAAVNVNPDGSYTYDPTAVLSLRQLPAGSMVMDTFNYTVQDDDGFDTSTVTITVTGVNEDPVAVNDAYSTDENTPLSVPLATSVLNNDSDVDTGTTLTVTTFDAASTQGAVVSVAADGSFTYDPTGVAAIQALAVGQTVVDTFTYTISDGDGGSDTATVSVTVSGRNEAPTPVNDTGFATNSDTPLNVTAPGVLANDTDPDAGDVLRVEGMGAQPYTFATITFDQASAPNILTPLAPGVYDAAVINAEPTDVTAGRSGFPDDTTNFRGEYSLGRLLKSTAGTTVSGVNLPLGDAGATFRSGLEITWESGLSLTNLTGDDFVIYESGGANAPEGFMVQVRGTDSGIWSRWVYVPSSQVAAYGNPGEFIYATLFNLDDFGISANESIDAFRIANLIAADRIETGTRFVLPGDNDATSAELPDPGPLASFANYGASTFDPDPVYLGVLHQLIPTSPAFDTMSAQGATVVVNADGSFSYDPTTSPTLTVLAAGVTMDDTFNYTVTDGFGGFAMATATVTVTGVNAPPTVSIAFPTNSSTFFAPASFPIAADAADVDGTVAQVEFFEATLGSLGVDTTSPFTIDVNNLPVGNYTLTAVATDDDGAMTTSTAVNISVVANPPIGSFSAVDSSGPFFLQSGLMGQTVTVNNTSPIAIQAVRLTLQNLAPSIVVYNATGTNGVSEPYLQHNFPVPAGGSVTFFIEYYVADRVTIPNPTLLVELMPVDSPVVPVGTVQSILRSPPVVLTDGSLLIDFATAAGRTYFIQYSADMATWTTVVPSLTGTGSTRQWIDNGPPKTESHPSTAGARFYRIIETP